MPKQRTTPTTAPRAPAARSHDRRAADVDAFISAHRNANTQATYTSGWRQFVKWATTVENPTRPHDDQLDTERPTDVDIAAYMQYIIEVKGRAMATVTAATAAIADHLRLRVTRNYNPCASVRVKQMRHVLVPRARPAQQKKEINWTQLHTIAAACAHTATEGDDQATALARRDSAIRP